ncbi:hypothetical protein [Roseococcus sp.]
MNHFQTHPASFSKQLPVTKPSSETAPTIGLSQAELRDIVIALLG